MQMTPLGRTGMTVSRLCLGTMTFGNQTAPEEAFAQIERAQAAGINFMDCAEMYPVNPVRVESVGRSEEILGAWFARSGRRQDWILATKITGEGQKAVRDGAPITPETIRAAIEGSLKRLRCEVIDLYQFHWPNRGSYAFQQPRRQRRIGQQPHLLVHQKLRQIGIGHAAQQRIFVLHRYGARTARAFGSIGPLGQAPSAFVA